jgi:hypothetical protein
MDAAKLVTDLFFTGNSGIRNNITVAVCRCWKVMVSDRSSSNYLSLSKEFIFFIVVSLDFV